MILLEKTDLFRFGFTFTDFTLNLSQLKNVLHLLEKMINLNIFIFLNGWYMDLTPGDVVKMNTFHLYILY